MTGLEIFLSIVLWIIIGLWISWKRTWYKDNTTLDEENLILLAMIMNVVFMPLAFLWSFFREYLNDNWDQGGGES